MCGAFHYDGGLNLVHGRLTARGRGSDNGKTRARDSMYFDILGGIFCEREEKNGEKRMERGSD